MPRILCIIDTVGAGGGAEQLVAKLAPAMRAQDCALEVLALYHWPDDLGEAMIAAGVPLHRLGAKPGAMGFFGREKALREFLAVHRYDLFWGHLRDGNFCAVEAAALVPGSKAAITLHSEGYATNPPMRLRDRLAVYREARVLGSAPLKVAVSKAVAEDYQHYFGWDGIKIVHNGIDVSGLSALVSNADRASIRARAAIRDSQFLITCAARYVAKKGLPILFEAVRLLRERDGIDAHLRCFGTGPLLDQYRSEIHRMGLSEAITLGGVIEHGQLIRLIAASDAFALPSLREPFGIAAAEAMIAGAPCALTAVDGLIELVGQSDGALMVRPGDSEAFAQALGWIAAHPDQARALAGRGQAHVAANFSIEKCASDWIATLDSV